MLLVVVVRIFQIRTMSGIILVLSLKNKRPTWCHLLFYFTSYVLNMFRTLIYPSSGACDCVVALPHPSSCSKFVVCWSFGAAGFGWCSFCRLKHNLVWFACRNQSVVGSVLTFVTTTKIKRRTVCQYSWHSPETTVRPAPETWCLLNAPQSVEYVHH